MPRRGIGATADADPVPHDSGDDRDEHEHHHAEARITAPVADAIGDPREQPVVSVDRRSVGRGGSAGPVARASDATEPTDRRADRRADGAAGDGGLVLPELLLDARVRRRE